MKTLRQVLTDMRRGDVLEALDEGSRHDSGFDSGFGSQSLSINRSEGEVKRNQPHAAQIYHRQFNRLILEGILFFFWGGGGGDRIYSIERPGPERLLNFWTLRVGAYSRLGVY